MSGERYTQEFKIAEVKQITQEGHSIPDVARRPSITTKSLSAKQSALSLIKPKPPI